MRFAFAVAVAVAVGSIALPRVADACSYPDGIHGRNVMPADGAAGVPTNTRVVVHYEEVFAAVSPTLELRPVGGGPKVPAAVRVTHLRWSIVQVLTPLLPLAPGTDYEVLDNLVVDEYCNSYDCEVVPHVVATFATGPGADLVPPTSSSASVTSSYDEQPSNNSCGGGASVAHQPSIEGVSDDQPVVLYNYYAGDGTRLNGPLPLISVGHACGSDDLHTYDLRIRGDRFLVRAVDLAGNEDWNGHVLTGESCDELDGGCQATSGTAGLWLGLAALAGLRRRRRAAATRP
jgi:uncharacterized protein (TIGR03382 family)